MMRVEGKFVAEFRKIGKVQQFREGRGRAVQVDGVTVAVFRRGKRFHAFDDTCPHMGASLADGRLLGERVRCSWHEWTFDLDSGQCDRRVWACIPIHEVRVEGDDVLVRLAEPPQKVARAEPDDDWFVWDPD